MTAAPASRALMATSGNGRGGHDFKRQWHHRELPLDDGDPLSWVLIDDPAHLRPHAECFRRAGPDGPNRGVHPTEAAELLAAAGHPDVAHVHVDTHVGQSMSH